MNRFRKGVYRKRIEAAIPGSRGMITTIANRVGLTRVTVYKFLYREENQDLFELIEQERETLLDFAESKLVGAIDKGDVAAIKFYLSTQGKKRGYIQRVETDVKTHADQITTIRLIERTNDKPSE